MRPRRPSRPQDEQLYRGSHRPLPRRPRVQGQARRAGREVRLPVARLPVPFSAKVYKKHPRGGGLCWGAIGARGSGSRGAPYPSPGRPTRSDAGKTPRMTRTRRFWGISPLASRTAGRDPGPDLARGIVFRPLSGSTRRAQVVIGTPWRAHAGATPRAGGAGAVFRRGSGLPGAVKGARARPGATARCPAPDRARVTAPAPSASPPNRRYPKIGQISVWTSKLTRLLPVPPAPDRTGTTR